MIVKLLMVTKIAEFGNTRSVIWRVLLVALNTKRVNSRFAPVGAEPVSQ